MGLTIQPSIVPTIPFGTVPISYGHYRQVSEVELGSLRNYYFVSVFIGGVNSAYVCGRALGNVVPVGQLAYSRRRERITLLHLVVTLSRSYGTVKSERVRAVNGYVAYFVGPFL